MLDCDPEGWTQQSLSNNITYYKAIYVTEDGWLEGGGGPMRKKKKKLNHLPFTTQFFAIQLVHGVVSISVVIKLLWTQNRVKPFNETGRNLTDAAD